MEDLDPEPDPDPNLIILDPDPCDQIMKDPSGFGTLIMSITVSDPRWSHADPTPDFSLFIMISFVIMILLLYLQLGIGG